MEVLCGFGCILVKAHLAPEEFDTEEEEHLHYFLELLAYQPSQVCIAYMCKWLKATEEEFCDWWNNKDYKIFRHVALIAHPDKNNKFGKAPGLFNKLEELKTYINDRQPTLPPQPACAPASSNAPSWSDKQTVETQSKFEKEWPTLTQQNKAKSSRKHNKR